MCYSPVRHSLFISIATEWSAFDLHVLGTPPAFILSQDQTLHRDSRPAKPPQKRQFDQPRIRESPCSDSNHGNHRPETFYKISKACVLLYFDSQPFPFPANRNREDCPHWLLALTISFSRSDRAHTDLAGVGAGCPKGLFRTYYCRKVSFGRRKTMGGLPGGRVTLSGSCARVNAFRHAKSRPGAPPGPDRSHPIVPAVSVPAADTRRATDLGFPLQSTPLVACGEPLRPSARHPVSGAQQAFRSRSAPIRAA
jgi:hypothetical protein